MGYNECGPPTMKNGKLDNGWIESHQEPRDPPDLHYMVRVHNECYAEDGMRLNLILQSDLTRLLEIAEENTEHVLINDAPTWSRETEAEVKKELAFIRKLKEEMK